MKVSTKQTEKEFKKFSINLEFETEEEVNAFYVIFNTKTIADFINSYGCQSVSIMIRECIEKNVEIDKSSMSKYFQNLKDLLIKSYNPLYYIIK